MQSSKKVPDDFNIVLLNKPFIDTTIKGFLNWLLGLSDHMCTVLTSDSTRFVIEQSRNAVIESFATGYLISLQMSSKNP